MAPASRLAELKILLFRSQHDVDDRRNAAMEKITSSYADPDFAIALLALAASASDSEPFRVDASIHLTSLLRRRWPFPDPDDDDDDDDDDLQPIDRAIIKRRLCDVFIKAPPGVQAHLAEALGAAAASDPANWNPPVLPCILSYLEAAIGKQDFAATNAPLAVLSSFFSRAVRLDADFSLQGFAVLHGHLFKAACCHIQSNKNTASGLRPMFEVVRLCCQIFFWVKSKHSSDYLKDNLDEWMTQLHWFLTTSYHHDVEADGAPDALRAAIIHNMFIHVQKFEDFRGYMGDFLVAVSDLLKERKSSGGQLVMDAIRFSTMVVESMQHAIFQNTVKDLLDAGVMPNLRLHDDDEELFTRNPMEFVKRDLEWSDVATTRCLAASRLLRGLAANYKEQVAVPVSARVQQLLTGGAKDWKEIYSAIYLVIALKTGGGTPPIISLDDFFRSVIVPELAPDKNSEPMLKAAVLRFLKEFVDQITKTTALPLLSSIAKFVIHDSIVVHSYAAAIIESLLNIKDAVQVPGVTMSPRYSAADINQFALEIIQNLSTALCFLDSHDNPFLMRCLTRVLEVANITGPAIDITVSCLVDIITKVLDENSDISYYLFEALAVLISQGDGQDPALGIIFETKLGPVAWRIMDDEISELFPYAIQILAEIVNFRRLPFTEFDKKTLGVLVSNAAWDQLSCVPALVCLLRAYFRKFPDDLHTGGAIDELLRLFYVRIGHFSSENSAIKVVYTLVETVSERIMGPYMLSIWTALFSRSHSRKAAEYLNSVGLFMSLVVARYGLPFLVTSTNISSTNTIPMLTSFINVCWIPNLKLLRGALKVKQAVVFSTKLLCSYEELLADEALWGKLLDTTVAVLSRQDGAAEEQSDGTGLLQYSRNHKNDLLSYVDDSKAFLVTSLATLSAKCPGRFAPIINKHVNQENMNVLQRFCGAHQATIV